MDKRLEKNIIKAFNIENCDLKELVTFRYDHHNNDDMSDENERSLIDLYQFLPLSFDVKNKFELEHK